VHKRIKTIKTEIITSETSKRQQHNRMKTKNIPKEELTKHLMESIPKRKKEISEEIQYRIKTLREHRLAVRETKRLITKHEGIHEKYDHLRNHREFKDLKKNLQIILERQQESIKILCAIIRVQKQNLRLCDKIIKIRSNN